MMFPVPLIVDMCTPIGYRVSEGAHARISVTLKGGPVEILSMLLQHREANKVRVLIANLPTIDKEVILLFHQLTESVLIYGTAHTDKNLRVLQVGRESAESLRLTAVCLMKVVKLLCFFIVRTLQLVLL